MGRGFHSAPLDPPLDLPLVIGCVHLICVEVGSYLKMIVSPYRNILRSKNFKFSQKLNFIEPIIIQLSNTSTQSSWTPLGL